MEFKRFPIILLAAVLVFALAACARPASRAPTGQVTPTAAEGEFPLPGTQDVMGQLEAFATQTAIAIQGGGEAQATPPAGDQVTPVEETPAGEIAGGETEAAATPETGVVEAGETPVEPEQQPTPEPQVEPTNTLVPFPTATPGIPATYRLRGGEFPYCIARRFDVDPGELLRVNGLGPNTPTSPGLTLQIPQGGNPFPGNRALKSHPTTYTVQAGDTVYSIACQFGDVDPNAILLANGLSEGGSLEPGQTIQIP